MERVDSMLLKRPWVPTTIFLLCLGGPLVGLYLYKAQLTSTRAQDFLQADKTYIFYVTPTGQPQDHFSQTPVTVIEGPGDTWVKVCRKIREDGAPQTGLLIRS
jgi:hypothetical protein